MIEEKNDNNSLLGLLLMGAIMLLWLYLQPPIEESIVETSSVDQSEYIDDEEIKNSDKPVDLKESLITNVSSENNFNSDVLSKDTTINFENDLIAIEINNKGGFISSLYLKGFNNHLENPIYLINGENSVFNLNFKTLNNKSVNTKNQYFTSSEYNNDGNKVIVMKLIVSENQFLEYKYIIKPDDYMIDFSISSKGLSNVINTQDDYDLTWDYKSLRNSKSIEYENRYSRLTYEYETDKVDKLGQTGDDEETISDLNWFSYRQHFFSAILLSSKPLYDVK